MTIPKTSRGKIAAGGGFAFP